MKLNRTPNPLDRNARNGENDNWDIIEGSIKRIDDTVSDLVLESGGDSNLEVVQARGGKPVLNDRLNSIDTQLADTFRKISTKTEKSYVDYEIDKVRDEISGIITTPAEGISEQEIIDARESKISLGTNVRDIRKRTNVSLNNLVKNGDFTEGNLDGFQILRGSANLGGASVVLTSDGTHSWIGAMIAQNINPTVPTNGVWYVKSRIRALDGGTAGLNVAFKDASGSMTQRERIVDPEVNKWYDVSYVIKGESISGLSGAFGAIAFATYSTGTAHAGKRIEVQNLFAVNLSTFFYKNNEPTKEEFDKLLSEFPYSYLNGSAGELSNAAYKEALNRKEDIENVKNDLGYANIRNFIENGDFNVTTGGGWKSMVGTLWSMSNNKLTLTGTGADGQIKMYQDTNLPAKPNHKIFVKALYKYLNNVGESVGFGIWATNRGSDYPYNMTVVDAKNKWVSHGDVLSLPSDASGTVSVQLRMHYPTTPSAKDQVSEVEKVIAIDLTETFGAGNEPDAKELSKLIDGLPSKWFNEKPNSIEFQKALTTYSLNKGGGGEGNKGLKRPLIAVTFDDGFRTDYDLVYPEFLSRGIRGTSYIWTDRTDNYSGAMDWEELKIAKMNGWGIECHTDTHPSLAEKTNEEIHQQFQTVNSKFEQHNLPTPRHHALPNGSGGNDSRVTDIVMQYRKTCRNIQGKSLSVYNDWDTIDFSALSARSVDGVNHETIVANRKADIDAAYDNDGILILIVHEINDPPGQYETPLSRLLEIVDYALAKGMKFVTMEEMYQRVIEYQGIFE